MYINAIIKYHMFACKTMLAMSRENRTTSTPLEGGIAVVLGGGLAVPLKTLNVCTLAPGFHWRELLFRIEECAQSFSHKIGHG